LQGLQVWLNVSDMFKDHHIIRIYR
jgi:hypothetical protein